MDFQLSKEQQDIKSAAREFAEKEFSPIAKECDEKEEMDMSLFNKARELGFLGAYIPEEYGGPGLGFFDKALIVEEFWRIDPGLAQAVISATFGAEILIDHGTETQKKKYLPPLVEGNAIMGTAITAAIAIITTTIKSSTIVKPRSTPEQKRRDTLHSPLDTLVILT